MAVSSIPLCQSALISRMTHFVRIGPIHAYSYPFPSQDKQVAIEENANTQYANRQCMSLLHCTPYFGSSCTCGFAFGTSHPTSDHSSKVVGLKRWSWLMLNSGFLPQPEEFVQICLFVCLFSSMCVSRFPPD